MAAKHFAGDVSPSWFEDDPLADISLRFGRHFKEPEPPSASLETLTEQADDPSDAVRRYIDQLTAELEYQSRRPVVKSWHATTVDVEVDVDKSIEELAESIPQIDEAGEDDELVESPLQAEASTEVNTVARDVAQLNETLPALEAEPEPAPVHESESAPEPESVSEVEPEPAPISETVIEPEPVPVSEPEPELMPELEPTPEPESEPLEPLPEELPVDEPEVKPLEKAGYWAEGDVEEVQDFANEEPFETVEPQVQVAEPAFAAVEELDEPVESPAQAEPLAAEPVVEPSEDLAHEPLDAPVEFEERPAEVPYVEPDLVEEAISSPAPAFESRQLEPAAPATPITLEPEPEAEEPDTYDELEDTAKLQRITIPPERLVEQHQEQRIRVSTNLRPPDPPAVKTTTLDKRRPLGFFARIGEFVARLLHLDDH